MTAAGRTAVADALAGAGAGAGELFATGFAGLAGGVNGSCRGLTVAAAGVDAAALVCFATTTDD